MITIKRPNGCGSVRKLSGKRRHPYQAVVSVGHEIRHNEVCVKQMSLGCYATRKEALEALAVWQSSHTRLDLQQMTVEDVWNQIKPTLKESQLKNFIPLYNRYASLHKKRLSEVKTYDIEQIPLPPLSNSSHDKIRALWHNLFEYGIANDIIDKDYSQYIRFPEPKKSRERNVFTPTEIEECLKVVLYKFLLYTGMRINELLEMPTDDVYEEDGILCFHVRHSKTDAGIRTIPVHKELLQYIDLDNEYVIEPHKKYNIIRQEFADFMMEHNIGTHVLHDFRRTFTSYAKSCGVDDFYAKCLLGHVHHDITRDVYTTAFVRDLKREIDKVSFCNK